MKKYIKYLVIMGILFLLTGCTTTYTRADIVKYVKEKIGLTNFEVSRIYMKDVDEDRHEDKIWTVVDKDKNLTFYVVDDYQWGMESMTNYLRNDYYDKLYLKEADSYNDVKGITYELESTYGYFDSIDLYCKFTDRATLEACYKSLSNLNKHFDGKNPVKFTVQYDFSKRDILSSNEDDDADTTGNLNKIEDTHDEILYTYYNYGLVYDIDSIVKEFTEEEYYSFVEYSGTEQIYKIDDDKNILYTYDGAFGLKFGYGLTYETLYKILYQEGYTVVGNSHNYKVYYNEDIYEFSDSFIDSLYENGTKKGYYYIKNGEKQTFLVNWYKFFNEREVEKMFDIKVKCIENKDLEKWPW